MGKYRHFVGFWTWVFCLVCNSLLAQTVSPGAPDFLWSKKIGEGGFVLSGGIAVDKEGNNYVAGTFINPTLVVGSQTLVNRGSADLFVAKYDRDGNWLWAVQGGGSSGESGGKVAVDDFGNLFLACTSGSATFELGGLTITNHGGLDFVLAKLNQNGQVLWLRHGSGPGDEKSQQLAVDATGNSFLAGYFSGTNLMLGSYTLTNRALLDNKGCVDDLFLAKYDPAGNLQWVQQLGSWCLIPKVGITTDPAGNCYVTGGFFGNAPFGSTNLQAAASRNIFLAKFNPDGQVAWARQAGGTGTVSDFSGYGNFGADVRLDTNGNIFVAGTFASGVAAFDSINLTNRGFDDLFLAKFNPAGSVLWARSAGGTEADSSPTIALDQSGNCLFSASFDSSTLVLEHLVLTNTGTSSDIYFCRYDTSGNVAWARQIKGNSQEFGFIGADPVGNVYTAGSFTSVNLQLGSSSFNSQGNYQMYVAKLDTSSRPKLTCARVDNSMTVSWNALFSGYQLQWCSAPSGEAGWSLYNSEVQAFGLTNVVDVPMEDSGRFFRLTKPQR